MSTPFHVKYFAHEISRHHAAGSVQQLTHSLFDACVDLNPHQIEAALFAIQSPLSHGVLLADEVGLGKTIEAGLLLCQYWAERKRKLLVICPASLRRQWSQEMSEKFHLPNTVLDSRLFSSSISTGKGNPFDRDEVFIVSIHFAGAYSARLRTIDWDLVVIDEAHKLRNVYRKNNKLAQAIKWALEDRKKILLTATPLQNSLMELYGLASIIDDYFFGDPDSFRKQYVHPAESHAELRERLAAFSRRTLRNQVTEYIRYTERRAMTLSYTNSDEEQALYEQITEFIRREDSYSLPKAQRHLMTLVLHKILASSRYAVIATLRSMLDRLYALKKHGTAESALQQFLIDEAIEDEYLEEESAEEAPNDQNEIDLVQLQSEINELESLIHQTECVQKDTKADTLIKALEIGFKELRKMQASQKAIIFTESRRTQAFLAELLHKSGYEGKIVLFNGSNDDRLSRSIYEQWVLRNQDAGLISSSRMIDQRTALIDHFRDAAEILIATEAGAEGINLQFCSLVINYDLPWNPQRIEQRIGRCHRYGQKHDVVVINFLNQRNAADARVYELLDEKFHLFNGVFGASDEILGIFDTEMDFERRILAIYQQCRRPEEIEAAFTVLQREMEAAIQSKMSETRRLLLEHFDYDVHERLRINLDETRDHLDAIGRMFWEVSQFVLADIAEFDPDHHFELKRSPLPQVRVGRYHLVSKTKPNIADEFLFRLAHPLGEYVLAAGRQITCKPVQVYFDLSNHPQKISPLEKLKGQQGWLQLMRLSIESFEPEEYLLFVGISDKGKILDQEICRQFFHLRAATGKPVEISERISERLDQNLMILKKEHLEHSSEMNNGYFIQEIEKMDRWSDDVLVGLEKDIDEVRREIRRLSLQARLAHDPLQQHQIQVQLKTMEQEKSRLRRNLFEVEDQMMQKRESLIDKVEKRMHQQHRLEELFTLRWYLV
ncbi:MAG: DEAD/DEAH box helicase [Calditrichaeota bacterium]|nr:MAG: DEAD/DEAH box helicase [Calditrichota bacterium]